MRIAVELPRSLLKSIDDVTCHIGIDRQVSIRRAVTHYINQLEAEVFELELAAGYAANAEMSRALAAEFAPE